jgi:selenocysteine lyase/cysteine desulfurase
VGDQRDRRTEAIRSDFAVTQELIYLDTAYDGPYPSPVLEAGKAFLERRARGVAGRLEDWLVVCNEVKTLIGELINAHPSEIAITGSTTEGTNIVANSLRTQRSGSGRSAAGASRIGSSAAQTEKLIWPTSSR